MLKIIVIYESKYGNTKRVAELIIEGMNEINEIEASLKEIKEVDLKTLSYYDVIIIGSPNHMGGPTRGIKGFIDKLGKIELEEKMFAFFDTYMGKNFEKAVKKMEKQIKERNLRLKQIVDGLSIKVQGMKGPIVESEFLKCKEFGKKIVIQLKRS